MRFADLSPGQQDAAIDETIDVVFRVVRFIRPTSDPNARRSRAARTPGGWRDTWASVARCLARHELPPIDVLGRVAGWACNELYWRERYRPLTPDEERIKVAAWRLFHATHPTLY